MTPQDLAIATGARIDRATENLAWIEAAMADYEINTPARQAAFLSQIGHESGGLHWLNEIWGPTPAQRRYEGRLDLGNTQPGDGERYKGHGWLQITGRENHREAYERLLGRYPAVPNFEEHPEEIATPKWAAITAAEYWARRGCNELADAGEYEKITRIINGGLNGYGDRVARWENAKEVLA